MCYRRFALRQRVELADTLAAGPESVRDRILAIAARWMDRDDSTAQSAVRFAFELAVDSDNRHCDLPFSGLVGANVVAFTPPTIEN
jgi:hypothetical protein